jgi:dihydrofolate reductase
MRRIIVNIATSADGYIARRDGGIDWLDRPPVKGDYGLAAFARSVDTILYGRKTYDLAMKLGGVDMFGPNLTHYVFSNRKRKATAKNVRFIRGAIKPFARRLRARPGKDIWMMGGGEVIASFLDAGEIDEFQICVIPVFIGEGIPLIAPRHRTTPLKLLSTKKFSDGVVRLQYEVERAKPKR